ncbi:DUF4190 domain-containing protein [Luteipulveratus flavus]|uniref:Septum formation family protein n=1 Tax=Luteipulveratus flavus TaxID=3031728 RepID=A0ABT6CAY4_9MICO|nr:DUF4190 domain-containing protein [Luteipulveratus sp. YIM 133296]MDF8266059.1 septum formation family protein [Luteipulveratus sp. YIM 133296]
MTQPPSWGPPPGPQHPTDPYSTPSGPPANGPAPQSGPYGRPPAAPTYGGAYAPYGPYAPQAPQGTNGFAIAGFVLGLIGGCLLGLIFSIIGLVQIKKRGGRGRGLAIAGLCLSIAWTVAVAGVGVWAIVTEADRDSNGSVVHRGDLTADDIRVGDCINQPDPPKGTESVQISSVQAVPCTEPHDLEAYAESALTYTGYPGDTEVTAAAERACTDRFTAFVGTDMADSDLAVQYFHPTRRSWALGDHDVTCLVGEPSGRTTLTTLRGAAR